MPTLLHINVSPFVALMGAALGRTGVAGRDCSCYRNGPGTDPGRRADGNLDAASAQEALTILSRLNREHGKTIVMVTHDPHAASFATRTQHLEKGELVREGAASGVS